MPKITNSDNIEEILGIPSDFEMLGKSLAVNGFYGERKDFMALGEDPNIIKVELVDKKTGVDFEMPLEMIKKILE